MFDCDGVCRLLGVQWWIWYIGLSVVIGYFLATLGVRFELFDRDNVVELALYWLVAMAIWPIVVLVWLLAGLGWLVKSAPWARE